MSEAETSAVAVGRRIRDLRVARGLSQQQLAEPELSASYLSRLESGNRPATLHVLAALAARLGSSVEFLRDGVDVDRRGQLEVAMARVEQTLLVGDAEEAEESALSLQAEVATIGGPGLVASLAALIARCQERQGRLDDALSGWLDLEAGVDQHSELWFEAATAVARLYRMQGDLWKAANLADSFVDSVREAGLMATVAGVRLAVTAVGCAYERGDLTYAARLALEAIATAEALGDSTAMASALWNGSAVLAERGQLAEAVGMARRAADHMGGVAGRGRETASIQLVLAHHLIDLGETVEARRLLDVASLTLGLEGTPSDVLFVRQEFARAALRDGDSDEAVRAAREAVDATSTDSGPLHVAESHLLLGRALVLAGRPGKAAAPLRRSAQQLAIVGLSRSAARIWSELAASLDEVGDVEAGRDAYRAAVACLGLLPAVLAPAGVEPTR